MWICPSISDLRCMSRPLPRLGERTILSLMYCHLYSQMLVAAPACGGEISSAGSLFGFPSWRYWSTPFHSLCFACLRYCRERWSCTISFHSLPTNRRRWADVMEKRLDAIAWWGQQTATRAEAYGTWGIKARILDQRWIFSWSVCAFIIVFNKGDSLSGWHNGTFSRFESDSLRIYIWLQCKFVVSLFRLGSP